MSCGAGGKGTGPAPVPDPFRPRRGWSVLGRAGSSRRRQIRRRRRQAQVRREQGAYPAVAAYSVVGEGGSEGALDGEPGVLGHGSGGRVAHLGAPFEAVEGEGGEGPVGGG